MGKKINKNTSSKNEKVIKKKRKKLTQDKKIKIIAISFVIIFLGSIVVTGLASIVFNNNNKQTPSNYSEINSKEQLEEVANEYELKLKENPEDVEIIYNLIESYSQLGYYERSYTNEEAAISNFMKAVEYAALLKEVNPQMATSADYLRAGYLAEAGKLEEARGIYEAVIASNVDPIISRIIFADFLKNKVKDDAASRVQVQAAKDAANSDEEKKYVESLIKQYNL